MTDGLARRSLTALLWNYLGNAARAITQFAVAIVLARLLGPAAFGVVAVGWLVLGMGALFGDLGFSAAIIQRSEITRRDVDFAFTLQLASSLSIAIGILLAAPWLSRFFAQPDATPIVRAMAASVVIRAFGQTPGALLQRDLRFRTTQIIAVVSYGAGFGAVSIALAASGFGAWSLVGGQLAQTTTSSLALHWFARRRIALALSPTHRDIARTGFLVIAANAGSWCIINIDSVIVGHVAGATMLGLYNRASALAAMPMTMIVNGLLGVVLSASSRAQADPARLKTAFFGSIALFVLLGGSALAAMAMVPDTIIVALFGSDWRGAAPLLTPLSIAMLLSGMLAFASPVLTAMGAVRKEAQAEWLILPAMTMLILLAARHSAVTVAWAVVASYALRLLFLYRKVNEELPLSWRDWRQALLAPLCIAIVTAVATRLADRALPAGEPIALLAGDIASAGLTLAVATLLLRQPLLRGPLGRVLRSSAIVPVRLRGLLWIKTDPRLTR